MAVCFSRNCQLMFRQTLDDAYANLAAQRPTDTERLNMLTTAQVIKK